jgi:hypothetical protein
MESSAETNGHSARRRARRWVPTALIFSAGAPEATAAGPLSPCDARLDGLERLIRMRETGGRTTRITPSG